jgi:predicted nucleic-acid-binding Zn-ribbon protein
MKTEWQCPKCKTKELPKLITKLIWHLEFSEIIADDIIFEIDEQFNPEFDNQESIECSSCGTTFKFQKNNNFITLEIPAN